MMFLVLKGEMKMSDKKAIHTNDEQQIKENENAINALLVIVGKSLSNASQSILQANNLIVEIHKILEDM